MAQRPDDESWLHAVWRGWCMRPTSQRACSHNQMSRGREARAEPKPTLPVSQSNTSLRASTGPVGRALPIERAKGGEWATHRSLIRPCQHQISMYQPLGGIFASNLKLQICCAHVRTRGIPHRQRG